VKVQLQGLIAAVMVDSVRGPKKPGDTVQFHAQAVDSAGDPVQALYFWTSQDTATMRMIDVMGQAPRGLILRKLRGVDWVYAKVHAVETDTALVGFLKPGDTAPTWGSPSNPYPMAVGEQAQACLYVMYQGQEVFQSQGAYVSCPLISSPVQYADNAEWHPQLYMELPSLIRWVRSSVMLYRAVRVLLG